MSNNDYYNSFVHNNAQYAQGHQQPGTHPDLTQDTSYHGASDKPLPTQPGLVDSSSHTTGGNLHPSANPSPFTTPFDDAYHSQNPSANSLNKPYSYANSGDPFHDHNAIPLQTQQQGALGQKYADGHIPPSPTMAMGQAEQFGANRPQKRLKQKEGWLSGKITWAVYVLTIAQIAVFIGEIVRNATLTGSPIQTKPQFNPMIGPSPYVLINMGGRYVPCMRQYDVPGKTGVTVASIKMPCPSSTTNDANCSLAELCGNGMDLTAVDGKQPQPNQWWRFIVPIFLHGGLVHIGFNMLLQMTLGRDMEKTIGTLRFVLVYFSAGIFGFVFGGNFSPNGIVSTGASGSLFGILALVLLDLFYTWKSRPKPGRDLLFILLDIVIAFIIGLLPALDNFSHIGGFLTGLVLGICLLHSPDALRERIGLDDPPYAHMNAPGTNANGSAGVQTFVRQPASFFKGRKPLWWAWWLIRVGALVAVFVSFIVLLNNFYVYRTECKWCKYLSCLPVKNWCEIGTLQFTEQPAKRMVQGFIREASFKLFRA